MSLSGLRTLKREWSSSANDFNDNGVGVVATKAKGASSGQPCAERPSNTNCKPADYDYDLEFGDLDWVATSTPMKGASSGATSSTHQTHESKGSQSAAASSSGFVKASQIARESCRDKVADEEQAETSAKKEEAKPKRKRDLPMSFTHGDMSEEKFRRTPFAKTASELRSSGERLKFLMKSDDTKEVGPSTVSMNKSKDVGKIFLSKEQLVVYHKVVTEGRSIFFTGSAGTGKSVLLREIIKGLQRKYMPKVDAIAVTASTGIAACNIGGTTLHSFSGGGLCLEPADKLVTKIRKNKKSITRWMRTNVLIIDEISMIAPDFLDTLERLARIFRRNEKPFGGLQIVMTGDFFQLPPVNKGSQSTKFAFDAKCWPNIATEQINLTQVFRQKDPGFVNMLNELRFGKLSRETIVLFSNLSKESELHRTSTFAPTILFPMRHEVDRANAMELMKIKRPAHTFDAIDDGTQNAEQRVKTLENMMAPAKLHLKMGCQVMLIKNTDEQLVNGSLGQVLCFLTSAEWHEAVYSGMDWETLDPLQYTEEQIRELVRGKYSDTRKREKDMTDLEKQALNSVPVDDANLHHGAEHKKNAPAKTRADLAEAIYRQEKRERSRSRSVSPERREPTRNPVVRFLLVGHSSRRTRTILVEREVWKNEHANGEVLASRQQIPLILAWAMSIHKSQGQTLPLVKIDLSKTFEKGQAYVALSRAVSKEGLQVIGFDANKVRVDHRVVEWYKNLVTVESAKSTS